MVGNCRNFPTTDLSDRSGRVQAEKRCHIQKSNKRGSNQGLLTEEWTKLGETTRSAEAPRKSQWRPLGWREYGEEMVNCGRGAT